MMVAPERDVPGISAKHCAKPTLSASRQVMSSTDSTRTVCWRRSAHRITSAPTMKAIATGTGRNSFALMALPNSRPSTAAGMNATTRFKAKRCAAGLEVSPASTPMNLARYSQHHRQHRAGLDHDLEDLALLVVEAEQVADQDQVAGAGDRQELGETFDDAQDERFEQERGFHSAAVRQRAARRAVVEQSQTLL